jgi:hypothetical protein
MLFVAAASAEAAYLYDWDNAPSMMVNDDNETGIGPGQDILAAWHAYDGTYHYFRIDLEAAPSNGDVAEIYGIYIDSYSGGGSNNDVQYIPNPVSGVDFILDAHFYPDASYNRHDYHVWSPYLTVFNVVTPVSQHSENGGTTIEWQVERIRMVNGVNVDIGTEFTWQAADLTQGSPSTTHDLVEPVYFPEPATGLCFLLGIGAMIRRR